MTLATDLHQLIQDYPSLAVGLWVGREQYTLFDYQAQRLCPSASIIKLPIYRYYLEAWKRGEIALDTQVEILPEEIVGGAGVIKLLSQRTEWTIQELLQLMIAVSDNTATNALIEYVGLPAIQSYFQTEEIKLTRLLMRPDGVNENLITPNAAGKIMAEIYRFAEKYPEKKFLKPFALQQFREGLPGLLDEQEIPGLSIYNKTGRLDRVEHDVACMTYQDNNLVVAAFSEDLTGSGTGIMWLRQVGACVHHHLTKKDK